MYEKEAWRLSISTLHTEVKINAFDGSLYHKMVC